MEARGKVGWSIFTKLGNIVERIGRIVEKVYSLLLLILGCVFGWVGLFILPFDWFYIKAVLAWYVFTMFSIMVGYHRYFAHRSFKTSRAFQLFLAVCGSFTLMGGVMWWSSRHRQHHHECGTIKDKHSPEVYGFWRSHVGWILKDDFKTDWKKMPDFVQFPELRFLDEIVSYLYIIEFAVFFLIDRWLPLWILSVGMCITYNIIFSINSLTHMFGDVIEKSEFCPETCSARNIAWLAIISFGEGWHNNHHSKMTRANHGFINSVFEIDIAYLIIKALEFLGIVWDVRDEWLCSKKVAT